MVTKSLRGLKKNPILISLGDWSIEFNKLYIYILYFTALYPLLISPGYVIIISEILKMGHWVLKCHVSLFSVSKIFLIFFSLRKTKTNLHFWYLKFGTFKWINEQQRHWYAAPVYLQNLDIEGAWPCFDHRLWDARRLT